MNCEHVTTNLSRYHDGEMSESESRQCADHICGCQACQCELASFESISTAMNACQTECGVVPTWAQMVTRLDAAAGNVAAGNVAAGNVAAGNVAAGDTAGATSALSLLTVRRVNLRAIGLGLALAASMLLLAVAQIQWGATKSEIAVDLSTVIDRYASQPSAALAHLNTAYAGRTVEAGEFKKLLGYEPMTPSELPAGVELVSTSVLHLPVCSCVAGKCTCGPAGCNCAALLCRRSDGSELLVLEHCDSDKVELSKQPARIVKSASDKNMQLYGTDNRLTASWVVDNHRLTAIGLRSELEASEFQR